MSNRLTSKGVVVCALCWPVTLIGLTVMASVQYQHGREEGLRMVQEWIASTAESHPNTHRVGIVATTLAGWFWLVAMLRVWG